jgi:glycerol-3-phosphate cytidylyltransferase
MKTVITYGTFDLFHLGHVRLLRRLAALGDQLVVVCSTDEFNVLKGKKSVMPFKQRVEILASCRYVDKVLPEQGWAQKRSDIIREGADIFGMGSRLGG